MEGKAASSNDLKSVGEPVTRPRCSVCEEPIKKHKCLHYGTITCYSCRAFFRRSCIKMREEGKGGGATAESSKYECVGDGCCNVVGEDRHKCRLCRFNKCLAVGMKPQLVLSEEEKAVKFKKYYKNKAKKDIERKNKIKETDGQFLNDDKEPQLEIEDKLRERITSKKEFCNAAIQTQEKERLLEHCTCEDNKEVLLGNINGKCNDDESDGITTTFKTTAKSASSTTLPATGNAGECSTVELATSKRYLYHSAEQMTNRVMPHQLASHKDLPDSTELLPHPSSSFDRQKPWNGPTPQSLNPNNINKGVVSRHLETREVPGGRYKEFFHHAIELVLAQFESYMTALPQFQTLTRADQVALQARNSKVFLAYVMARVFTSGTFEEQLHWIFGEHNISCNQFNNQVIPFCSFVESFSSLHNRDINKQLLSLAFHLKSSSPLPPASKHLVAMMFAFHMADEKDFSQPGIIKNYHNVVEYYLHNYHSLSRANQGNLLKIVNTMIPAFDALVT